MGIQTRRRRGMVVQRRRTRIKRKEMIIMARSRAALARVPTCYLTFFTTSSGASTWPWNRHLRSVLKTSSITETNRARLLHKNGHEGANWSNIRIYSHISSIKYIHTVLQKKTKEKNKKK